jgi:hypothetical protein
MPANPPPPRRRHNILPTRTLLRLKRLRALGRLSPSKTPARRVLNGQLPRQTFQP